MTRKRFTTVAGTCMVLLALGGCVGGGTSPASTTSDVPAATAEAPSQDQEAVAGDEGGSVAPNSESTPEAAQAYLECLTDAGVDATIVDETRVVLVADVSGGSANSSETVSQAEEQCHKQVPEYVEPDFNQR